MPKKTTDTFYSSRVRELGDNVNLSSIDLNSRLGDFMSKNNAFLNHEMAFLQLELRWCLHMLKASFLNGLGMLEKNFQKTEKSSINTFIVVFDHAWKMESSHLWNVPGALQRPKGMRRSKHMARLWTADTFMKGLSPVTQILAMKTGTCCATFQKMLMRGGEDSFKSRMSSRDISASSMSDLYEVSVKFSSNFFKDEITTLKWSKGGRSGINNWFKLLARRISWIRYRIIVANGSRTIRYEWAHRGNHNFAQPEFTVSGELELEMFACPRSRALTIFHSATMGDFYGGVESASYSI
ncbi:hypothetical protein Tco_1418735 [Tanacetum coccineum]